MARTRAADYEDKRELIREEAARLFAAHGFARTSLEALARACGASKSLFYHYYESKEALLYDMLKAHVEELLQTAEAAGRGGGAPAERLRHLVRALMRIYARTKAKHVVLLNDLDVLSKDEQQEIVRLQRRVVARFASLVRELGPAVEGAPGRRTAVTMAFLGMINFTYTWFDPEGPIGVEAFADLATDLFLGGIRAVGADDTTEG